MKSIILISDFISDFSGLLVGILVLAIGIYILLRWRKQPTAETMWYRLHHRSSV